MTAKQYRTNPIEMMFRRVRRRLGRREINRWLARLAKARASRRLRARQIRETAVLCARLQLPPEVLRNEMASRDPEQVVAEVREMAAAAEHMGLTAKVIKDGKIFARVKSLDEARQILEDMQQPGMAAAA